VILAQGAPLNRVSQLGIIDIVAMGPGFFIDKKGGEIPFAAVLYRVVNLITAIIDTYNNDGLFRRGEQAFNVLRQEVEWHTQSLKYGLGTDRMGFGH